MDLTQIVAALLAVEGVVWLAAGLMDWEFFIRLTRTIPYLAALDRRTIRALLAIGGVVLIIGGSTVALRLI